MEINRITSPTTVGVELKKQPEQVKDTGLKKDTFEASQKSISPEDVMKSLDEITLEDGKTKKFRYPAITNSIYNSLKKEPQKAPYIQELAKMENVTAFNVKKMAEQTVDDLKDYAEIFDTKNKDGKPKFESKSVGDIVQFITPAQRNNIKVMQNCALNADNIIKAAQEKDLNYQKVATKANEMAEMIDEKDLKEVVFARDAFSKGDYTVTGKKNNNDTIKEILDHDLNRYALETLDSYKSANGTGYKIKKVADYRNNTVAKTRFTEDEKGVPRATHEIRIIKDKKGNVQRTEYTQPSEIKGVMDIKYTYPDGRVQVVSSGTVDKKTGITSIKKDMVSTLGTRTEYLFEDDPQGNRISDYKVTDKNGKVLLQNSEAFEVRDVYGSPMYVSSKNDKTYVMVADENGVQVADVSGETIKSNSEIRQAFMKASSIPEKFVSLNTKNDITGNQKEIINVLKKMPGEEIFKLRQNTTKLVGIDDLLKSYSITQPTSREIHTGDNLFVILHELGHAVDMKDVDMMFEKQTIKNAIFEDKQFNEIYAKEKDAFNKAFPDSQRNHISYFINHETHYNGEEGGRKETIAEANALLTTAKSHECLAMRSQYLQQHFPETIAYLDKKLNEHKQNTPYDPSSEPDGW